ncbi:MAK10-like protein [Tanacetum coccineum]
MGTMWCLFNPTPSGWTSKLRNDILMFQQHQGESLSEAWTRFKDLLQKLPHDGIDLLLQIQIFYDHVKPITTKTIEAAGDVPSTSDRCLIELENQVQRLMEAHLAPNQLVQVNKIASSCKISSGPHDTQYCKENPKQAFVEYASSHAKISRFEVDFKQYQSEMTNKLDTFLKAFNDQITRALPSDTFKYYTYRTRPEYKGVSFRLGDSKPFNTLADLGSCVNLIPLSLFKKLKIWLLEETDDVLGLADGTKSYPVGIMKNIEVHVGKLKLFEDFHVVDMEREPTCPLLVGRGFFATSNVVIDCKKAKIAVGEGLTRSIFEVRELDFGEENMPYWTTIGKRKSYKPRTSEDGIGARPPYYAKTDFWDNHVPGEWDIARDAEVNPFNDVLVFRKMVEFLKAIPINLKGNMWKSKDLVENCIYWNRPPKEGDGVWHIRIKLIDPDGEKFDRAFQ